MARTSTRPIVVTFDRKGQLQSIRHYVRVFTAIPRAVAVLLETGHPGDVAEIASAEHGFQIATVKVHAGSRIDIKVSRELNT